MYYSVWHDPSILSTPQSTWLLLLYATSDDLVMEVSTLRYWTLFPPEARISFMAWNIEHLLLLSATFGHMRPY
jgi:hypothetical protein